MSLRHVETRHRFGKAFLKTVSPKLAVRHHRKPMRFLTSDHFANRLILRSAKFFVTEPPPVVAGERFLQFRRSNQAPDMIDAKSFQIFR